MPAIGGGPGVFPAVGVLFNNAQAVNLLGQLSQTNNYLVSLYPPAAAIANITLAGVSPLDYQSIGLLATSVNGIRSNTRDLSVNEKYPGVSVNHASQRLFTNEISIEFYVRQQYETISFFEAWLETESVLVTNGLNYVESPAGANITQTVSNAYYRQRYPDDYKGAFTVTKFERSTINPHSAVSTASPQNFMIQYSFTGAYPNSINSIACSYEGVTATKVTIGMQYDRYVVARQTPFY